MKKFVPPSVTFVSLCVFPLNLPYRLSLFALLLLLACVPSRLPKQFSQPFSRALRSYHPSCALTRLLLGKHSLIEPLRAITTTRIIVSIIDHMGDLGNLPCLLVCFDFDPNVFAHMNVPTAWRHPNRSIYMNWVFL